MSLDSIRDSSDQKSPPSELKTNTNSYETDALIKTDAYSDKRRNTHWSRKLRLGQRIIDSHFWIRSDSRKVRNKPKLTD